MANFLADQNYVQPHYHQPIYRLVLKRHGSNAELDVTDSLEGNVVYETIPDNLAMLSFSLRATDYIKTTGQIKDNGSIKSLRIGDMVTFWGGSGISYSKSGELQHSPSNYKKIFYGTVMYIKIFMSDEGLARLDIECHDITDSRSSAGRMYSYPSKVEQEGRPWATGESIKKSDLIKHLAKEAGYELFSSDDMEAAVELSKTENNDNKLGISLADDTPFTLTNPFIQRAESDISALKRLAKKTNCSFWVDYENSNDERAKFNFVDNAKLVKGDNFKGDIVFLYPYRNGIGFEFTEDYPNHLIAREVTIEHDYANMLAAYRIVTIFNHDTGLPFNAIAVDKVDRGKKITEYYQADVLKDEAVDKLNSQDTTEYLHKAANFMSLSQSEQDDLVKNFLKPFVFSDKIDNYLTDNGFLGIKVKLVVDGNVNIVPHKHYKILGIWHYSSEGEGNISATFYLRLIKHTFSQEGFDTECHFLL